MNTTPVIAYQLSLLGESPKPCRAWRPTFYFWTLNGEPFYVSDDARRQMRMLTPSQTVEDGTEGET